MPIAFSSPYHDAAPRELVLFLVDIASQLSIKKAFLSFVEMQIPTSTLNMLILDFSRSAHHLDPFIFCVPSRPNEYRPVV